MSQLRNPAGGGGRPQKDQLVFSSEDSLNSNNSFASSIDEDDHKEDFANQFLNLKDQMEVFLTQNPLLNEAMKFEPFREPTSDDDMPHNHHNNHHDDHGSASHHGNTHSSGGFNPYNRIKKANIYKGPKIEHRNLEELDRQRKQGFSSSSSEDESEDNNSNPKHRGSLTVIGKHGVKKKGVTFNNTASQFGGNSSGGAAGNSSNRSTGGGSAGAEKSKLWNTLTKDIVRMGQFGCKTPTLETVNHRLNIFKTKIEKIDYLDYLQKEMISNAGGQIPAGSASNAAAGGGATGGITSSSSAGLNSNNPNAASNSNLFNGSNRNNNPDGSANAAGNANGEMQASGVTGINGQSTGLRQSLSATGLLNGIGSSAVNGGAAAAGGSNAMGSSANNGQGGGAGSSGQNGTSTSASANGGADQFDDDENNNVGRDSDGNLIYFSFRKRMQTQLQKKIEKTHIQKDEETRVRENEARFNTGKGGRRANMVNRGALDAKKLIQFNELMEKKNQAANPDLKKGQSSKSNKSFKPFDSFDQTKESKGNRKSGGALSGLMKSSNFGDSGNNNVMGKQSDEQGNHDKDAGLQFQTRVGIALYQTYQQCAGDKESFKKTANFILKDYNKTKQQFFKKKAFPPTTVKFTNEETKALNVYLPDFTSNLYAPNKASLFANIDSFELPVGTPEAEFLQVVDKILDGSVLRFWKDTQNQQQ